MVFQHQSSSGINVKIRRADGIRSFIQALHELSYKEECFRSDGFLPVTVLITGVLQKMPRAANSQFLLTSVFKVGAGKSVRYSQLLSAVQYSQLLSGFFCFVCVCVCFEVRHLSFYFTEPFTWEYLKI